MDLVRTHPAFRYEKGVLVPLADPVVNEVRVEMDINDGQARIALLALPQDLEALAVGFLTGEGVLRRIEDLAEVKVDAQQGRIAVAGDFDQQALEMLHRRWTWGSGCGGGGTSRDVDCPAYKSVAAGLLVKPEVLLGLMGEFQQRLELWRATGAVHACALCDPVRILHVAQDVGRHNAFDKVIGRAVMDRQGVADKIMITTGRLSAEIVSKAIACGLPVLVSRCAVTGLAIDLARRFGATLIGFARAGRLNVYTGYERIVRP